jgi:hypothetical protein
MRSRYAARRSEQELVMVPRECKQQTNYWQRCAKLMVAAVDPGLDQTTA